MLGCLSVRPFKTSRLVCRFSRCISSCRSRRCACCASCVWNTFCCRPRVLGMVLMVLCWRVCHVHIEYIRSRGISFIISYISSPICEHSSQICIYAKASCIPLCTQLWSERHVSYCIMGVINLGSHRCSFWNLAVLLQSNLRVTASVLLLVSVHPVLVRSVNCLPSLEIM